MSQIQQLSDIELIRLLKSDDYAAFTEIYNRYGETLAGFAGAKLYHLEDARDLLHDIFVKLWEERHTLIISGNLKSYLFSATRYRIIDKIRRNITRQDYALMMNALSTEDSNSIDRVIEAKELAECLERSLNKLPPRTKQIFQLSRNEHHTVIEIAEMLNLSEQTVKNQLTAALKHLRQSISYISITVVLYLYI
jgi:RNA polymerase sigma-70 factor (family 1)